MAKKDKPFNLDLGVTFAVTGASKVKKLLGNVNVAVRDLLHVGQDRLEKFMLERTQQRFAPPGANPSAQKDPQGRPWAPLSRKTKRKRNKNRTQKLVDTGQLYRSIMVVKKNMAPDVLASPTGGGFSIGVNPSSSYKSVKYAWTHQKGAYNWQGRRIPKRAFLGIGPEDVAAVREHIRRTVIKSGLQVR
jgi:phage gpG-like protein